MKRDRATEKAFVQTRKPIAELLMHEVRVRHAPSLTGVGVHEVWRLIFLPEILRGSDIEALEECVTEIKRIVRQLKRKPKT